MTDRIQIIRHEVAPKCGSYEVRFPDGRPSKFFFGETSPAGGQGRAEIDPARTQLLTWRVRRPLITCTCWLDACLIIMLPTLGAVNRIREQGAC